MMLFRKLFPPDLMSFCVMLSTQGYLSLIAIIYLISIMPHPYCVNVMYLCRPATNSTYLSFVTYPDISFDIINNIFRMLIELYSVFKGKFNEILYKITCQLSVAI